jgi:hypothetical protein
LENLSMGDLRGSWILERVFHKDLAYVRIMQTIWPNTLARHAGAALTAKLFAPGTTSGGFVTLPYRVAYRPSHPRWLASGCRLRFLMHRRPRMGDSELRLTLLAVSCLSGVLAQTASEQSGAGNFMNKLRPPIAIHARR